MSEWVTGIRDRSIASIASNYDHFAKQCESPIEEALFWALVDGSERSSSACEWGIDFHDPEMMSRLTLNVQTGWPFSAPRYRLDMALSVSVQGKHWLIAIECDGHDFHERTKEQAAKDRARDRELMLAGVATLRFTGSEIFKDAPGCARTVFQYAQKLVDDHMAPIFKQWADEWVRERQAASKEPAK